MLSQMSWPQFCDWVEYAELEPFGEERADMRSALIASILANVNRDPKKKTSPYTIGDFMLFPDERSSRKSARSHGRAPLTSRARWGEVKQLISDTAGAA